MSVNQLGIHVTAATSKQHFLQWSTRHYYLDISSRAAARFDRSLKNGNKGRKCKEKRRREYGCCVWRLRLSHHRHVVRTHQHQQGSRVKQDRLIWQKCHALLQSQKIRVPYLMLWNLPPFNFLPPFREWPKQSAMYRSVGMDPSNCIFWSQWTKNWKPCRLLTNPAPLSYLILENQCVVEISVTKNSMQEVTCNGHWRIAPKVPDQTTKVAIEKPFHCSKIPFS